MPWTPQAGPECETLYHSNIHHTTLNHILVLAGKDYSIPGLKAVPGSQGLQRTRTHKELTRPSADTKPK